MELIKKIWGIAWDLGEHCNGILHVSPNEVSIAEQCRLHRKVVNTFQQLQNVALQNQDRHLITLPLPRLLKKDLLFKQTWLHLSLQVISGYSRKMWTKCMPKTRRYDVVCKQGCIIFTAA
jgi:hypothetical protein